MQLLLALPSPMALFSPACPSAMAAPGPDSPGLRMEAVCFGTAREGYGMFSGTLMPDIPMSPGRFPVGGGPPGKQVSSSWHERRLKTSHSPPLRCQSRPLPCAARGSPDREPPWPMGRLGRIGPWGWEGPEGAAFYADYETVRQIRAVY